MGAPEQPRLILASTSPYRRALLKRLGLAFACEPPGVEENALSGESPAALSVRLARAKAEAVHALRPEAVVIGSDQVAELDRLALGKPGGRLQAVAQLRACRGRDVIFHTAVCVLDAQSGSRFAFADETRVRFRALSDEEIERYIDAEQPFDCAGSFKSEGLGVTLFSSIHTEDPTALVGLPLIALANTLRACGYLLP